ncbi:hypothetical protein J6590_030931 [Homalodisca vitripennis]|nr:hypothetical protein J6590_030931 [Homalodisca vitripennis]
MIFEYPWYTDCPPDTVPLPVRLPCRGRPTGCHAAGRPAGCHRPPLDDTHAAITSDNISDSQPCNWPSSRGMSVEFRHVKEVFRKKAPYP